MYNIVMKLEGKTIGKRVAEARNRLKMTQVQLAEKAQISLRTLQDIEYENISEPSALKLSSISKAMNTPIELLISGSSPLEIVPVVDLLESLNEFTDAWKDAPEPRRALSIWVLTGDDDLLPWVAESILEEMKRVLHQLGVRKRDRKAR